MTDTELSELLHTHTPEPPPSIDLPGMAARIRAEGEPARRRRLIPMTAAAAVIATVALAGAVAQLPGDGSAPTATSGPSTSGTSTLASGPRPTQAQLTWARTLVDRLTGQAFVPLGSDWNFQQLGSWTDPAGSQRPYVYALDARRIASRIDLSYAAQVPLPAPRWADGRPLPLPVLPLRATFNRLLAGAGGCGDCGGHVKLKPLTVTAASPSTMRVQTARGPVVLPAWRFTFAETRVQALQAAVDLPMAAVPMSSSATSGPPMDQIDRVRVAANERSLIASFMTAPCGQRYAGYAVESDYAVGIVLVASNPGKVTCLAPAGLGRVTVHLAAPLKDRVVIETVNGTAVPVDH